jgi:tetratricopeptide (TPR) repeat protein
MAKYSPGAVRLLALNGALPLDAAARTAMDRRAWDLRFADAHEMLVWANLAVELAESPQIRSLSHAHLGNAYRIAGQFAEARRQLDLADQLQEHSDPLLLEFRASLLENVGVFDQALSCLRSAGRMRADEGDVDGEAKIQAQKGHILTEAGQHAEAAQVFRVSLEKVQEDFNVARVAVQGLSHALARSGQPFRALAVLREAQPLLEGGDTLFQLRVTWLLGRIAMLCGDDNLAATNLEAAHFGFVGKKLLSETCLTALDLALHHARCGRTMTAHKVLDPVPELLAQLGVPAKAEIATSLRHLLEGEIAEASVHLDRLISSVENRSSLL